MTLSAGTELHDRVSAAYEDARDDVYRYVMTLGLLPAQAQEVTQETFLRLYLQLRDGGEVANVRAWVFRVAHNHGLNVRSRERSHVSLDQAVTPPPSLEPDPEQLYFANARNKRVQEAWQELSPQQRQVLHLRVEGLRYREIAETLGIGIPTVNEFLRRAISKLRKVLHE